MTEIMLCWLFVSKVARKWAINLQTNAEQLWDWYLGKDALIITNKMASKRPCGVESSAKKFQILSESGNEACIRKKPIGLLFYFLKFLNGFNSNIHNNPWGEPIQLLKCLRNEIFYFTKYKFKFMWVRIEMFYWLEASFCTIFRVK